MKLIRVLTVLFIVVIAFGFGAVAQVKGSTGEFTIAGIVVDNHSGQPLVSTTVSIAPTEAQTDSRSAITGPDGRFRFTGLAKGKYSMLGKRRGYLAQGFDEHEQYSSAIAVGPDQDSSHLVFRLHPDAAIRGRILDESNEAVPQMQVMLFSTRNDLGRRSTRMVSQTTTNDLGEYFFTHLGEGTYYLLAVGRPWYSGNSQHLNRFDRIRRQREGMSTTPEHERLVEQESALLNQSYPLTFFDNVQDWTQASGIDLAPGDRFTADFRVTAVPAATLHIKTAASENRPLEQGPNMTRVVLQAKVFDDQTIPVRMNYGNAADGSRALVGIPPGHYLVQTRNPSDPHDSVQELDISGEMDLPPASGGSGAVVSGKFVWDGTPMTGGFGVQLTNSRTDRHYFFMPRPNGEFVVSESVLPGKYELAVSSQFGEVYVKSVTIGGATSSSTVQIEEGADVTMTVTLARGTGTIDGVAVLEGKPKAGAMVVLIPADGWIGTARFRRDQSDSDGTFTLRNVVPGNYTVVALRDGWKLPWSDPKTMKSFLTEGTPVKITSSEKTKITVKIK